MNITATRDELNDLLALSFENPGLYVGPTKRERVNGRVGPEMMTLIVRRLDGKKYSAAGYDLRHVIKEFRYAVAGLDSERTS